LAVCTGLFALHEKQIELPKRAINFPVKNVKDVARLVTEGKKVLAQIPEWNGRIREFEVMGLDYENVGLYKCLDRIIRNWNLYAMQIQFDQEGRQ